MIEEILLNSKHSIHRFKHILVLFYNPNALGNVSNILKDIIKILRTFSLKRIFGFSGAIGVNLFCRRIGNLKSHCKKLNASRVDFTA